MDVEFESVEELIIEDVILSSLEETEDVILSSSQTFSGNGIIGSSILNNTVPTKRALHATPSDWKRNTNKTKRAKGMEYESGSGRIMPEKKARIMEDCKCRFRCHENIPPDHQVKLFQEFMNLGDTSRKKSYLSQFIKEMSVQRKIPRNRYTDTEERKKEKRSLDIIIYHYQVLQMNHQEKLEFVSNFLRLFFSILLDFWVVLSKIVR